MSNLAPSMNDLLSLLDPGQVDAARQLAQSNGGNGYTRYLDIPIRYTKSYAKSGEFRWSSPGARDVVEDVQGLGRNDLVVGFQGVVVHLEFRPSKSEWDEVEKKGITHCQVVGYSNPAGQPIKALPPVSVDDMYNWAAEKRSDGRAYKDRHLPVPALDNFGFIGMSRNADGSTTTKRCADCILKGESYITDPTQSPDDNKYYRVSCEPEGMIYLVVYELVVRKDKSEQLVPVTSLSNAEGPLQPFVLGISLRRFGGDRKAKPPTVGYSEFAKSLGAKAPITYAKLELRPTSWGSPYPIPHFEALTSQAAYYAQIKAAHELWSAFKPAGEPPALDLGNTPSAEPTPANVGVSVTTVDVKPVAVQPVATPVAPKGNPFADTPVTTTPLANGNGGGATVWDV